VHWRAEHVGVRRRLWIPFAVYAAVTLALPLLRRADRQEAFWEHAAVTLIVPAIMLSAGAALARAVARVARGGRPASRDRPARAGRNDDGTSVVGVPKHRELEFGSEVADSGRGAKGGGRLAGRIGLVWTE
jgi:hypothetical protein